MPQLNLQVTPDFENNLRKLMKRRGFKTKSEAVSVAVQEAIERETQQTINVDKLVGLALQTPLNPHPKFNSDNALWK